MVERALVLLNTVAGRGHARQKQAFVREAAKAAGVAVESARSPEEMEERARAAASAGYQRVIAAGGDGTAHHVLNGLVGTGAALGIIPCGSGNDLANGLGIPRDIQAAAQLAFCGPPRAVDLCRLRGPGAQPPERYYGCLASFGVDSRANRIANEHHGPLGGTALYVYALVRALVEFRLPEVTITYDGGEYHGRIWLVVAANAPSYGGGMRIAPRAQMADGRLDVCAVRRMPRLKLLWCFPEVFSGAHLAREEVTYFQSTRARIEADRPLEIFADGEFLGYTPAEVELLPGKLQVVAP